jgi:branched-chain amino acid transport system substrate-binding protein
MRTKTFMARALAVVSTALALATATVNGAAAQSSDTLYWSVHIGITGPLAYSGKLQAQGFEDFQEWVNKNGGIRGRKISININDSQYKTEVGVATFKRALSQNPLTFASGDGVPWVRAVSPENNETSRILMSSGSFASDFVDKDKYPLHYVPGPNYVDQINMLLDYIGTSSKGGKPRIAFVYSNTEFGRDPIKASEDEAKKRGFDVVLSEETKFTDVDVAPVVAKMRQARPDFTIFQGYATSVWPEIIRLSKDYGIKTQFMGTIWAMDRAIIKDVGEAVDGYMGVAPYRFKTTGEKGEMLAAIDAIRRQKDPKYDGYPTIPYMQSWFSAMIAKKAIEVAIDAGQPLTGPNLAAVLDRLDAWDTGGVFGVPIAFRRNRIPTGRVYRYEAKNNFEPVPVSEWISLEH